MRRTNAQLQQLEEIDRQPDNATINRSDLAVCLGMNLRSMDRAIKHPDFVQPLRRPGHPRWHLGTVRAWLRGERISEQPLTVAPAYVPAAKPSNLTLSLSGQFHYALVDRASDVTPRPEFALNWLAFLARNHPQPK